MFRDDLSMLKGNHLFQLGGTYQHNWDYHQRNDSGGTINAYPVYSLGDGSHGSVLDNSDLRLARGRTLSPTYHNQGLLISGGRQSWASFPLRRSSSLVPVQIWP